LRAILESRAMHIWTKTTASQRRGFYFAGVGVQAGLAIDSQLDHLVQLISQAEQSLEQQDADATCDAIEQFAEDIFGIPPFNPDPLPPDWPKILRGWLTGSPTAKLQKIDENANEFIQDGICYKLTWALEAVRARAAVDYPNVKHKGSATAALDVGSINLQEILLLRAGLRSRTAAKLVVEHTGPSFKGFKGMRKWLLSPGVQDTLSTPDWPTEETAAEWQRFVMSDSAVDQLEWTEQEATFSVAWHPGARVPVGERVRLYTNENGDTHVFSLALEPLGSLSGDYARSVGPQMAVVGSSRDQITASRFGPT